MDFVHTSLSPMNKSKSKQLYSFSKSIRFTPTPRPLSRTTYYEVKKGALQNRTTTFGYGNKLDFANRQRVPPVGNYEFKSDFIKNRDKRNGYSFPKKSKANILINPQKTSRIPGPGAYKEKVSLIVDKYPSLSCSMHEKTEDPLSRHQNPLGPGQYETMPGTTQNGKYVNSRWTSSGCRKIGKERRSELANRVNTPGPGKYRGQNSVNLNKTGVYFNSKVRNMQAKSFQKSSRPPPGEDNRVPGPGSYTAFTQFSNLNRSWARN